jgi:mRNA-degrading endonuclease YafQ of YafQ-DinJ toxin-antitoxin module
VATPAYTFKRTPQFRRSFDALSAAEQQAAKEAFAIFKNDPFDPRLRTHKINRLSALHRKAVFSVVILNNLRAVFHREGNVITSLDIGSHDIYK